MAANIIQLIPLPPTHQVFSVLGFHFNTKKIIGISKMAQKMHTRILQFVYTDNKLLHVSAN